ncbi:hypothetical protein AQUCO_11800021v1 [Aquilegia coerulea]|uniref:Fe2OG dioxygenase domain-containing protein n=1 Tax=Aquilegia coerulea TaxID=218851 RepID=A0A2G5C233_AQUCA|nr:hypothetical protein AQUCO_11800021v1 [Aquilegia coerulea]
MALHFDTINLFDFVVKEGNGVKGLIESGLSKVPDVYIQPVDQRINKTNNIIDAQIVQLPLIDISELDGPQHDQVEKALVKAAETVGFFHVVNHGLPIQLLEELKDAAHMFFNQPAEKKLVYQKGVSPSPLVVYGGTTVGHKWRDNLMIIYNSDDDAYKYWPDQCKEVVLKYMKTSTELARRILEVLVKHLGVELDDSMEETYMGLRLVSLNYYPTSPDPELTVGIGKHSDIGTLTILVQDDIGGLSIKVQEDGEFGKEGEWIEVPPIPGALLINIGDALQILSNGKYRSVEHRVRNTNTQSRVSVPCFFNPGSMAKIAPLPKVVEKDGKAKYKECLFQDYGSHAFAQGYQGKKNLDFVKITSP